MKVTIETGVVIVSLLVGEFGGIALILWATAFARPRHSFRGGFEPDRVYRARRALLFFEGVAFAGEGLIGGLMTIGILPTTDTSDFLVGGIIFAALIAPILASIAFPGIMGNRY